MGRARGRGGGVEAKLEFPEKGWKVICGGEYGYFPWGKNALYFLGQHNKLCCLFSQILIQ